MNRSGDCGSLHNEIVCGRKKEETPTLHSSIDGTGEYYANWNKPSSERQIAYDLTYKWNLINKSNKWAKYNQRMEIKNRIKTVTREERGR